MTEGQHLARALHDLELAAWFGGSLMGAVRLNGAAMPSISPSSGYGWPLWADQDRPAMILEVVAQAMDRLGLRQPFTA